MKSKSIDLILTTLLCAVVVSGSAQTWTKTSAPTGANWVEIGLSADGKIACGISPNVLPVISKDGGHTWNTPTNTLYMLGTDYPGGIAMSADGTKIFGAFQLPYGFNNDAIFLSTNYGDSWMQIAAPTGTCVACSADGMKVIFGNSARASGSSPEGPLYISTNGGVDWVTSASPNKTWIRVASSADGQRFVAAAVSDTIYISTNSGVTWNPTSAPISPWRSVCSSSDGHVLAAAADTNSYVSTDSGATWIPTGIAAQHVASAADGTNLVIVGSGTQIYSSTNAGLTWITNSPLSKWFGAASTADGSKFVVGSMRGDGIWIGQMTPSPQMDIQPKNGRAVVSWVTPSTNFVLQQCSDLNGTKWAAVSNAPTLNFTNLRQEVTLPLSTNRALFRLIAQ